MGGSMGSGSRTFYRVRVAVLLGVLVVVCAWAVRDVLQRRERTTWKRTLEVAVVLLRHGAVDDGAVAALRERTGALEDRLAEEHLRVRGSSMRPVEITVYGPVDIDVAPP